MNSLIISLLGLTAIPVGGFALHASGFGAAEIIGAGTVAAIATCALSELRSKRPSSLGRGLGIASPMHASVSSSPSVVVVPGLKRRRTHGSEL